tara:strand:+ start:283 stop:489 length:207 start_codon:yes stop_codon:yes gene_type:complete
MRTEISRAFYVFAMIISTIMMVNMAIVSGSDYHIDTKVAVFSLAVLVWLASGVLAGIGALIERGGKKP